MGGLLRGLGIYAEQRRNPIRIHQNNLIQELNLGGRRQSEPVPQPAPPRQVNLAQLGIAGLQMNFEQQLQQGHELARARNNLFNRRPQRIPIQRVDPEIRQNLVDTGYDEQRNQENRIKLRQRPDLQHIRSENGMMIIVELFQNHNQKAHVTCSICQYELERKEYECGLLECMHWFHFDCIQNWLKFKSQCPDCKKSVGSVARLPKLDLTPMREDLDQTREYERNNQTVIGYNGYDELNTN